MYEFERRRTELAAKLRRLRIEARLSGESLGRRTGMSQSKVSKIENGRLTPSVRDVDAISAALGVDPAIRQALHEAAKNLTPHSMSLETEPDRMSALDLYEQVRPEYGTDQLLEAQRLIARLEARSTRLENFVPWTCDGLLQTVEFMTYLLPRLFLSPSEWASFVQIRLERQAATFTGEREITIVMAEAALSSSWLPQPARVRQVDAILARLRLPGIRLGILPNNVDTEGLGTAPYCLVDRAIVLKDGMAPASFFSADADEVQAWGRVFDATLPHCAFGDDAIEILGRHREEPAPVDLRSAPAVRGA